MVAVNRWVSNGLALTLGLAFSLGAAEVMLRVAGVRYPAFYTVDSHRGYGLRPGAEGLWTREGEGHVRINRDGFRGPGTTLTPAPGVLRIAVLGDSFTEALQVDEHATFVRQLQGGLRADPSCSLRRGWPKGVEVLNFGVGGYGTGQSLLTWRYLASRFHPQMVILAVYPGNDFMDNEPQPRSDRPVFRFDSRNQLQIDNSFRNSAAYHWRTSPPGRLVDALMNRSRLLQLLNEVKNRMGSSIAPQSRPQAHPQVPITPPASEQAWRITDALVGTLAAEVRASGARFAVVSTTSPEQVWPKVDQRPSNPFLQEQQLSSLMAARGIPYLPLAPALQPQVDRERLTLHGFPNQAPGLGHWNSTGHRLAAEAMKRWLCTL